ncbi:MAG: polymorphic toxin type 15 domain-containing protein [Spirochaetales bacterium]|nr:polymorphic toxin type 15 domain-containing protein [Spirochaetales bacterium]
MTKTDFLDINNNSEKIKPKIYDLNIPDDVFSDNLKNEEHSISGKDVFTYTDDVFGEISKEEIGNKFVDVVFVKPETFIEKMYKQYQKIDKAISEYFSNPYVLYDGADSVCIPMPCLKDISPVLKGKTAKETIASTVYATSILNCLPYIAMETIPSIHLPIEIRSDEKKKEEIKEVYENSKSFGDELKEKTTELAEKTLEISKKVMYVTAKTLVGVGDVVEESVKTVVKKGAELTGSEEFAEEVKNFNVMNDLGEKIDKVFNAEGELKDLGTAIQEGILEEAKEVAELILLVNSTTTYLTIKTALGAGHIVENVVKAPVEIVAKLSGHDEFASKVQQVHVIDDISNTVDELFEVNDTLKNIGDFLESAGELGCEIGLTILACSTGVGIPLVATAITLSSLNTISNSIDFAVDKTGQFTNKELLFGMGMGVLDAASKGMLRKLTIVSESKKVVDFASKLGHGVAFGAMDTALFMCPEEIAKPVLERVLEIDNEAEINLKKYGIEVVTGAEIGGLAACISQVCTKMAAKAANKTEVVGKQITKVEKVQDNVSKLDKIDDVSNKSVPEKIFLDKTTDVVSNVEKTRMTEKIEIKFKCNEGIDPVEMQRQLKGQERGLNSQTLAENIRNRERYKLEGRSPEGDVAQSIRRQKAEASRVNSNLKKGMSLDDARKEASDWIQTQAALHNPDQIAGGDPGIVSRMGDASVNSSIGAQWRTRVAKLEEEINNYIKGKSQAEIENTLLNVSLKMEIA